MIITGIPFDEKLNIGVLSKVFERKRISNCYKYFWFQAILENIVEDKVVFTYDEILNQMIEDAWYMVTEFKLRLGPCNTTDNLEEVVKYIHSKSNISSTAKRGSVIQYLKENTDPQIKKYLEIIYIFLTIFLYLLKCPQSLILSALRAFCFCGKPHISRSIFLYFRYQAWLKSW